MARDRCPEEEAEGRGVGVVSSERWWGHCLGVGLHQAPEEHLLPQKARPSLQRCRSSTALLEMCKKALVKDMLENVAYNAVQRLPASAQPSRHHVVRALFLQRSRTPPVVSAKPEGVERGPRWAGHEDRDFGAVTSWPFPCPLNDCQAMHHLLPRR